MKFHYIIGLVLLLLVWLHFRWLIVNGYASTNTRLFFLVRKNEYPRKEKEKQ